MANVGQLTKLRLGRLEWREYLEKNPDSPIDLRDANLAGADLESVILWNADLTGANLAGARLRGANLVGAILDQADLTGADLEWADLVDASLAGTRTSNAKFGHARRRKQAETITD